MGLHPRCSTVPAQCGGSRQRWMLACPRPRDNGNRGTLKGSPAGEKAPAPPALLLAQQALRRAIKPPIRHYCFLSSSFLPAEAASSFPSQSLSGSAARSCRRASRPSYRPHAALDPSAWSSEVDIGLAPFIVGGIAPPHHALVRFRSVVRPFSATPLGLGRRKFVHFLVVFSHLSFGVSPT